ncbi:AMP-binding protein, partial [Streptomyces sp. DT18]
LTAARVRDLTHTHHLTTISLTAGLFSVLAEDDPHAFTHLREVTTGGDIVPPAAVHAVLTASPDTIVRTTYGPTETTLCVTHTPWHPHDTIPTPV